MVLMATINWNPDRLGREEYEAARQAKLDHLDATYGPGRWSASMHLEYWVGSRAALGSTAARM